MKLKKTLFSLRRAIRIFLCFLNTILHSSVLRLPADEAQNCKVLLKVLGHINYGEQILKVILLASLFYFFCFTCLLALVKISTEWFYTTYQYKE